MTEGSVMTVRQRGKDNTTDRQLKNKIARAVFAAAESTGIADRDLLEQLAQQVIERLERLQPLPGMEDLIPDEIKARKVSEAEIQAKVREVLSEIPKATKRKAPSPRLAPDSVQGQASDTPVPDTGQAVQGRDLPSKIPSEAIGISPNAMVVLERRYLIKDREGQVVESAEELFRRVARHIASAEEIYDSQADIQSWEEKFYRMMADLEFLPNSPTLMNAGRELGQLSACFVLPVEDSMEAIFDAVKNTALIHKSGGGTGFSFSRLRPEKDRVGSTGGVASGPVSFMRAFDTATDVIKQGGMRRGANMAILNVDHPDIMSFITCKANHNVLTNFNISVAVTESFMKAVEQGTDYDIINPRTKEVAGRLNAREVFEKMVDMAWRNGDPGLIFMDRINRDNPTPHLGSIESTNPCVSADTWIMTTAGPRLVEEIIGKKFTAVVGGKKVQSSERGFFMTGVKTLNRVKTREGFELRATADHPLMAVREMTRYRTEMQWVRVGDVAPGDRVIVSDQRDFKTWEGEHTEDDGYLIGLLLGDGTIKEDKTILSSWGEEEGAKAVRAQAFAASQSLPHREDFKGWSAVRGRAEYRLSVGHVRRLGKRLGLNPGRKTVTMEMERASSAFYRGLLRGLFDADGSVQGSQAKGVSVRLAQSDLEMLKSVQRMLLRCGIFSRIYQNRRGSGTARLPDGKGGTKGYPIKPQHELAISKENLGRFLSEIGFTDAEKSSKLEQAINCYKRRMNRERFVATVTEVVPEGEEEVYDVHIPGVNAFDANGLYVHNCGEQPLLPYESCNLGSINLSRMISQENDSPAIDWERLTGVVKTAVRFLDNVIDVNKFPLPVIEEMTKSTRKIGLGVMGFADILIRLGIPYNSLEALKTAKSIMEFIEKEATAASVELARERGVFPAFEGSIYDKRKAPRVRNATRTTIAPTGTLSIIANCSSGIEPLFALSYFRHILDGDKLVEVNPLFEEVAKKEGFFSDELMKALAEKGKVRGIEGIPEWVQQVFVTAHDISPEWHVKMQAAFQRHTNNAVSKTINFPHEATREDVARAYMLAYKEGCKGITIYRDRSREAQVLAIGRDEKGKMTPRQRPDATFGVTEKMTTGCGNLYITVNSDERGICEVFTSLGKSGGCASAQLEAISRLISISLRAGLSVESLVKHIKGIRCPSIAWDRGRAVLSCADAIGTVLERHLNHRSPTNSASGPETVRNDGRRMLMNPAGSIGGQCPECGGLLVYQEGCHNCYDCGYTKCS
jgi:ribonucleoside-diphosphate reductase alpha chain